MKWLYLTAGLASLLISLAATAPARYIYAWSGAGNGLVRASGISGSVWHGRAGSLSLERSTLRLENVSWRVHPLGLLRAHLRLSVSGDAAGGHARGTVQVAAGADTVVLQNIRLAAPLADLIDAAGMGGLPLSGQVSARLARIELNAGRLIRASGDIALGDARWLLAQPAVSLGSFDAHIGTTSDGNIRANLSERPDSPLALRGTATLSPSGHWQVDARLRASPGAAIASQLALIGQPDADGWYHIRQSGEL